MEVYAVDSIVTRRSVEIDMQEVFGTDEVGSVVIDHGMKIYVPASALGTNRLDVSDFAEKISAFCKISVKLLHVLFVVLHPTSEMCVIEKTLEHNNINFEKRERPVNAGKVVDDSAGIILPSKPVVAKKDASEVHPKLTTVLVETNKPTHLAPAVPDKTTSNSQGVTAMLKQPLSAPRQRISHMAGSVPSVKHQPSLEYCDTEAEDSTESSADSELYNMKARHGIDTVSPQDYPALETRKALIRGRSSHDGTNRDTVARKSRPTTQRDCGLSPSTGRTANSRQDLSVLDDELNNIMPRSGPSGGNGPSKRLPGDNKLKSSFARSSTPLNNEGQLDLMEDHHVVRIGQQGELKVSKDSGFDDHKLIRDSSMSFSEAFSDLTVRPNSGRAKRAHPTLVPRSKKMKVCMPTLPLQIPNPCSPSGWLGKAINLPSSGFRPSMSQLSTVWRLSRRTVMLMKLST